MRVPPAGILLVPTAPCRAHAVDGLDHTPVRSSVRQAAIVQDVGSSSDYTDTARHRLGFEFLSVPTGESAVDLRDQEDFARPRIR